jgi:hypothetical protein
MPSLLSKSFEKIVDLLVRYANVPGPEAKMILAGLDELEPYDTEAELLADAAEPGTLGYAIDTSNYWARVGTTWKLLLLDGGTGFAISFLDLATSIFEIGDTLTDPSFVAGYSLAPDSASFKDDQGGPDLDVTTTPTAFTYTGETYTKSSPDAVVFTLSATKGADSTSRGKSVAWRSKIYYGEDVDGVSTEAGIKALTNQPLAASAAPLTFNANPGVGEHVYFAAPYSFGEPTFTIDGFEGGFERVGTLINVTNAFAVAQDFTLWKTTNPNLGALVVGVTFGLWPD